MDLSETQPCHDYDETATQKIELEIEKKQNVQIGVLIVNSNSYPIYKGISNIGRNSNCQVHLEDQSISKYHAEIEGHTYPMISWISDLNSCNKTILNNIVLRPTRYYELKDNSTIQFGRIKAIYKSCHLEKEFIIPETPEHIKQNNVTVAISETSDSLLTTYPALNGDNCIITTMQECSRKSISLHSSTDELAREILKNKSKYNVSKEINESACEQNDRSTSYESEDIFDAVTQHVNIDSYLKNIKDSSVQKEINNDENVDIDNTTEMEQICNTIASMSTPIKKIHKEVKIQVGELNSIEKDIASTIKRIQSKNESSYSVRENSKEKENNIDDFNESETQLICLPNFISNAKKGQTGEKKNDINNMETLNTQIIDFSGFDYGVNQSGKRYEEKNDTDIYPLNTQIINMESNNHSASAKEEQANTIANTIGTTSNSSIEDIDYETASTQIIGEMKITNGRTFKLAKSNFQIEDDDDDILSRLPEVTISGTLSNSPISVPLVKRITKLTKSRQSYNNKKTVDKSKICKTRSTVKNVTDTRLSENDKDLNKVTTNLISQKDNRLSNSMDKRMGTKENKVSVKSLTYKPAVNMRNKKNKKNIKKEINKNPRRNTRSMTNKEQEAKNDKSNLEMGEESQEVAMIMKNSLINDCAPRNIRRKRKIASTNLDDDSLNDSNNISRKDETNNVQYKVPVSRVKRNKLSKNNASQSSLDSMTDDDSLSDKDKDRSTSSIRKSSFTRSTNMEKQINENNTTSLNKRRKKSDLSMDTEINIRICETRKSISHLSSNTSFSTKERILFTGITDDEYVKILKVLGGIKVDDPSACTILVTDKIRRTTKFLCTLAKAVPIVSVNWLHESKRAGYFLDWNNYLLKDPAMEAKYGFRLRKSLEKARERQLLDGYTVLLTPNIVSPPIPELKAMIASCGGKAVLRAPSKLPIKTIIISHENDLDSTRKWLAKAPKDVTVQSTEFLLTGILKQELDFVRHKLI